MADEKKSGDGNKGGKKELFTELRKSFDITVSRDRPAPPPKPPVDNSKDD